VLHLTSKQIQELINAMKTNNIMVLIDTIKIINGLSYHKTELPENLRNRFPCLDCDHREITSIYTHCDVCDEVIINIDGL
jgi:hypothetical protein